MQQTKTMAKRILLFLLIFGSLPVIATTQQIIDKFVSDPDFIPSSIGICITDVKTGRNYRLLQRTTSHHSGIDDQNYYDRYGSATVSSLILSIHDSGTHRNNRRNRNFTRRPCDTRRRRPVLRLGIPLSPHRRFHRPNHTKSSVQSHQIDRGSHSCR